MRFSLCTTCVLLLGWSVQAQQTLPHASVKGEILHDGAAFPSGLMVELRNLSHAQPPERVPVMHDGSFEFRQLEIGQYDVKVTNSRGDVIQEDFIGIRQGERLVLRLRERGPGLPAGSGAISVRQLLHPVPSKAAKELLRAQEASRTGDAKRSIEHLEKALRIDPDYMEAHNNLGVSYMGLNQYNKAAAEFQKTVDLDQGSAKGYLNLGLALLALRRYPEAETAARRAVELEPNSIPAHYAVGQILVRQEKNTPEALENLQSAVEQYPLARLLVAHILVGRGAILEAIAELRQYLDSGRPEKRQEVQTWLDVLIGHRH